jgi:hypothetical protein
MHCVLYAAVRSWCPKYSHLKRMLVGCDDIPQTLYSCVLEEFLNVQSYTTCIFFEGGVRFDTCRPGTVSHVVLPSVHSVNCACDRPVNN